MRKTLLVLLALEGAALAQPAWTPPDQNLGPLPDARPQSAQPAQPEQPPPGSTYAQFVSTNATPWEISIDRAKACTTPCALWVPPLRYVAMHSIERSPVRLDVGYLAPGNVVIAGKPLENGKYVTGIVFTTFGGMALVTGITLAAVGCSTDRSGMCTAGAITGISGAVVTAGSIYLMTSAVPRAHIGPATPYVTGNQVGLAGTF